MFPDRTRQLYHSPSNSPKVRSPSYPNTCPVSHPYPRIHSRFREDGRARGDLLFPFGLGGEFREPTSGSSYSSNSPESLSDEPIEVPLFLIEMGRSRLFLEAALVGDRCELFLSASSKSSSSSRSIGGGGGALSLLAFRRLAGRARGDLLLPLAFSDDLRTGLLGEDSALVAAAEVLKFVCETGLLDRDGDISKSSKGTGE